MYFFSTGRLSPYPRLVVLVYRPGIKIYKKNASLIALVLSYESALHKRDRGRSDQVKSFMKEIVEAKWGLKFVPPLARFIVLYSPLFPI